MSDGPAVPRSRPYHVGHVRETLLDHAAQALKDGGAPHLNLRNLSRKTGVALGSVYHHFRSKLDLLAALAVRGFHALRVELVAAMARAESAKLRACIAAYFGFARREPALYGLMFEAQVAVIDEVAVERRAVFRLFEEVIAVSPEGRRRPADLVEAVGTAIGACVHGAAILATPDQQGERLIDRTQTGLDWLVRAAREKELYPDSVQGP